MNEIGNNGKADSKVLKVTSLEEIREKATPVVELPGWEEDDTIQVKMRRVSLLTLIQQGKLPNELLGMANKIASSGSGFNPGKERDQEELKKFTDLLHAMAKAALIEPSYDEIVEAAGSFTDDQLSAIFVYCSSGVRGLENFRKRLRSSRESSESSESVGSKAK